MSSMREGFWYDSAGRVLLIRQRAADDSVLVVAQIDGHDMSHPTWFNPGDVPPMGWSLIRPLEAQPGAPDEAKRLASELARRWLAPRLNMLARSELEPSTPEGRERAEGIAAAWRVAIEDLCMAFNIPEPQPDGPGAEMGVALLQRDEERRGRAAMRLRPCDPIYSIGGKLPVACGIHPNGGPGCVMGAAAATAGAEAEARLPTDRTPEMRNGELTCPCGDVLVESSWPWPPGGRCLYCCTCPSHFELGTLRELRGPDDPPRPADSRTSEEREAGVAKMRAWQPGLAKFYADLKRMDPKGEPRAKVAGEKASDVEHIGADQRGQVAPAVSMAGLMRDMTPEARRAHIQALFDAAPPEWKEVFAELDRRDPKMQAVTEGARGQRSATSFDMGTGPATFAATVLERQSDGELKPLATFEGVDAERQAREFATVQVSTWRPTFNEPHGSQRLEGVAGVPMAPEGAVATAEGTRAPTLEPLRVGHPGEVLGIYGRDLRRTGRVVATLPDRWQPVALEVVGAVQRAAKSGPFPAEPCDAPAVNADTEVPSPTWFVVVPMAPGPWTDVVTFEGPEAEAMARAFAGSLPAVASALVYPLAAEEPPSDPLDPATPEDEVARQARELGLDPDALLVKGAEVARAAQAAADDPLEPYRTPASPAQRDDVGRLVELALSEPDAEGECLLCHASMSRPEPELEPTPLCNLCAQAATLALASEVRRLRAPSPAATTPGRPLPEAGPVRALLETAVAEAAATFKLRAKLEGLGGLLAEVTRPNADPARLIVDAMRLNREALALLADLHDGGRPRAQELAERWRGRAKDRPGNTAAAYRKCAAELSEAFGLDPEGADHEPGASGTSPPAAQDGSSVPHGSDGHHSGDAGTEGKVS